MKHTLTRRNIKKKNKSDNCDWELNINVCNVVAGSGSAGRIRSAILVGVDGARSCAPKSAAALNQNCSIIMKGELFELENIYRKRKPPTSSTNRRTQELLL